MPRKCSICVHQNRPKIETTILGGSSIRAVARQFGVSKDALYRHRDNHMKEAFRAATERLRAELREQSRGHLATIESAGADPDTTSGSLEALNTAQFELIGLNIYNEVTKLLSELNHLHSAISGVLVQPDDPKAYFVGPRAEDVFITFVDNTDPKGPSVKRRRLSEVIESCFGGPTSILRIKTNFPNPVELLLKITDRMLDLITFLSKLEADSRCELDTGRPTWWNEWIRVRAVILEVLEPYPEIKEELTTGLKRLGA